jgi:transposase-like protein
MHWRQFLQSLMERGMHGLAMVIPDAHSGLRKALETCFPGTPWQRVPVPPAAERNEPCAQGIHAHRGGGRNTVDSDCAGQAGG